MGLLTINELSGLGAPRPADPITAARRLREKREEDRRWLEIQRRTEGSPLQRIAAEAAFALSRLKRMDQQWLESQRRSPRSRVGRISREAALARARVSRERAAAKAKLAAARAGQHYGWAITKAKPRFMSPGDHASLAKRRFKGLFYEQPKAWHVTPEGKEIPLPKVGAGWSRAGVATAARESAGMDLEAERKFVKHYRDARREGKGSPVWKSFWGMYWRRSADIERMERAYDLQERRRRRRAEERERQRMQQMLARRRAEYLQEQRTRPRPTSTYRGARAMAVPTPGAAPPTPTPTPVAMRLPPRPVTTSYRPPAPAGVTRGLVTSSSMSYAQAAPTYMQMPR
jgi:hypothetical protein